MGLLTPNMDPLTPTTGLLTPAMGLQDGLVFGRRSLVSLASSLLVELSWSRIRGEDPWDVFDGVSRVHSP